MQLGAVLISVFGSPGGGATHGAAFRTLAQSSYNGVASAIIASKCSIVVDWDANPFQSVKWISSGRSRYNNSTSCRGSSMLYFAQSISLVRVQGMISVAIRYHSAVRIVAAMRSPGGASAAILHAVRRQKVGLPAGIWCGS